VGADVADRRRLGVVSGFRAGTGTDRVRVALAKDLIADVRRFDQQLAANTTAITAVLDEHGTLLREIAGVGPVLAARLLGRTGAPSEFACEAAYAHHTGTSPVQIARAKTNRHRLPRWRSATELCDPHRGHDSDPDSGSAGRTLLRHEDRGGTTTRPDQRRGTGLPTPW